jgi:transcriptional regulator with XRE-family HTH domain
VRASRGHRVTGIVGPVGEDTERARQRLGELLRRIRRAADLSQRDLAQALAVSDGAVAQAESGRRDLPATVLMRAAELAGLRLAMVDSAGVEVPGMADATVRDAAGRHFPAHLDTRHSDEGWWHDEVRHSRGRPWYTFDRDRQVRDQQRERRGTPPDHQTPRPDDSPEVRARVRREAASATRLAEQRRRALERPWSDRPEDEDPVCTCPGGCDELLFATTALPARQHAVPHVTDCACRCDVA